MPRRAVSLSAVLWALFCSAALLGAVPAGAEDETADQQVIHILNRLGYGPTPEAVAHVKEVGIDRYIDEQLHPDSIAEPAELTQRLATLDTQGLSPAQLFIDYGPLLPALNGGVKPTPEEAKARRQHAQIIVQQAQAARVWRALYSRRQLQEVMVDFWFNHFNIFANKGLDHLWIADYENAAIRPHALGHFRDLLMATAHSPAMLFYLDNQLNTAPGSPGAKGDATGINENYAREIMELHTLGVDGGYTQNDVIALAHILTGWTLNRGSLRLGSGPATWFDPARHDFTEQVFLGRRIPAGGQEQGVAAIDMLAKSPATARHISSQLAQYFVADQPPPALVDRLTQRWQQTDGDIAAVLKTLFTSVEFRNSVGEKYKTPYQYVLSATRAAGLAVNNPRPLMNNMARLGEGLYLCQTPDGYKNVEDAWLSPDATTLRIAFATGIARGNLPLKEPPPSIEEQIAQQERQQQQRQQPAGQNAMQTMQAVQPVSAIRAPEPAKGDPVVAAPLEALLGPTLGEHTRAAVAEAPANLQAALLLGSPDFMRK
jgi:uncharacterized protein (DUF1800 family)